MLILPIKREWLEMIRSGEKKEEYRAISPYYTSRLKTYLTFLYCQNAVAEKAFRAAGEKGIPFKDIVLRAGYSLLSPAIMIHGRITVGRGRPEWGALPGEEYYILRIEEMEDLITDNKSYQQEGGQDVFQNCESKNAHEAGV